MLEGTKASSPEKRYTEIFFLVVYNTPLDGRILER